MMVSYEDRKVTLCVKEYS